MTKTLNGWCRELGYGEWSQGDSVPICEDGWRMRRVGETTSLSDEMWSIRALRWEPSKRIFAVSTDSRLVRTREPATAQSGPAQSGPAFPATGMRTPIAKTADAEVVRYFGVGKLRVICKSTPYSAATGNHWCRVQDTCAYGDGAAAFVEFGFVWPTVPGIYEVAREVQQHMRVEGYKGWTLNGHPILPDGQKRTAYGPGTDGEWGEP